MLAVDCLNSLVGQLTGQRITLHPVFHQQSYCSPSGWEPRSYGYHGDDGNIFNGRGYGQKYGPTFTTGECCWAVRSVGVLSPFLHYHTDQGHAIPPSLRRAGDVIGVLFDRVERTISFTKNGRDLGVAFQHVMEPVLYPTIGFRTPDEEVRCRVACRE